MYVCMYVCVCVCVCVFVCVSVCAYVGTSPSPSAARVRHMKSASTHTHTHTHTRTTAYICAPRTCTQLDGKDDLFFCLSDFLVFLFYFLKKIFFSSPFVFLFYSLAVFDFVLFIFIIHTLACTQLDGIGDLELHGRAGGLG